MLRLENDGAGENKWDVEGSGGAMDRVRRSSGLVWIGTKQRFSANLSAHACSGTDVVGLVGCLSGAVQYRYGVKWKVTGSLMTSVAAAQLRRPIAGAISPYAPPNAWHDPDPAIVRTLGPENVGKGGWSGSLLAPKISFSLEDHCLRNPKPRPEQADRYVSRASGSLPRKTVVRSTVLWCHEG